MTTISEQINAILAVKNNPTDIQSLQYSLIRAISGGKYELFTATNPLALLLEASAVNTSAFIQEDIAQNRKLYPLSAQTYEDLYYHMSDREYDGRFALPAQGSFALAYNRQEVINAMVLDPATGYSKVVIPRNTTITVSGFVFSLEYPIEIRQLAHGGLNVVWDVSKPTPLLTLESNEVTHSVATDSTGVDWLFLSIPARQFFITSTKGSLQRATPYRTSITFSDQYYSARVWVRATGGSWSEIATTHSEQTYDIDTPTAVLKVIDQTLYVSIPTIYTSTGLLLGDIRIDVYQTRGAIRLALSEFVPNEYVVNYIAIDETDNSVYTAPVPNFANYVTSNSLIDAGSDAMSFAQTKQAVISNSIGIPYVPITNVQIEQALVRDGYTIVKDIDAITNRVFLATRQMPEPTDPDLVTAANAGIAMTPFVIRDILTAPGVKNNGLSITITPDTLFKIVNGVVRFVIQAEIDQLNAMSVDRRALAVTAANYIYTPFHYVIDNDGQELGCRAYYLDNPAMVSKTFVAENGTTGLQVSSSGVSLTRTSTGYSLTVSTQSGDDFKQLDSSLIYPQLSFVPFDSATRAYLPGVLTGTSSNGERIYQFDLSTTFEVDANNRIALTKFKMFNLDDREVKAELDQVFDLVWAVDKSMPSTWVPNSIDDNIGRFLVPAETVGVTQEALNLRFGTHLAALWTQSRSTVNTDIYEKWAVDVPEVYEQDVYERNSDGSIFTIENGVFRYNEILHRAGDVVMRDGQIVYKYVIGDVKKDAYGQPILNNNNAIERQVDFFFIEGVYWFANAEVVTSYISTLVQTVATWVSDDLVNLTKKTLDKTKVYFTPTTALGIVKVWVGDGFTQNINASQSFSLNLKVSSEVNRNDQLKTQLIKNAVRTINTNLQQETVAHSTIVDALTASFGDDVIGFTVSQIQGSSGDISTVVMRDSSERLGLHKRLVARADDSLGVEEDVTINFELLRSV